MTEAPYQPSSDFLRAAIQDEVTFGEHSFGRANLARLIALTRDADDSNRDWATMLLARTGEDGPEVRAALVERLSDPHRDTRHEALLGVALRDRAVALPFVATELVGDDIWSMVLEAAAVVADRSLLPELDAIAESWCDDDPNESIIQDLEVARRACASEVPDHWLLDPDRSGAPA